MLDSVPDQASTGHAMLKLLRTEAQVPAVWLTAALFLLFGGGWFAAAAASTGLTLLLFAWLFAAILWGAFGVVRHAEHLAEKLGEPYGTLILTLSVTIIEVAFIVTAVATSTGSTPVARDAVFAVVMIMLNGTIGLCLLLGGLRHHEQSYNLPGARAFLSVVIPLAIFALILPNFTVVAPGPVLSTPQAITIAVLTLALYGVFLAMQTCATAASSRTRSRPTAARMPEAPPARARQRTSGRIPRGGPAAHAGARGLSHRGAWPHRRARGEAMAARRRRWSASSSRCWCWRPRRWARCRPRCATACSARSTSRSARCSPPSA